MTTTTENGTGLLRTILERPHDDCARLIYADWLEERGESDFSEFVRVQIELEANQIRWPGGIVPIKHLGRRELLIRRERELRATHSRDWFVDEAIGLSVALDDFKGPAGTLLGIVRRGFVDEVRCDLASWMQHGPAIVASQPVTKVVLTDRTLNPGRYGVAWFANRNHDDVPNPADSNWLPWSIAKFLGQSTRTEYPRFERHEWYFRSHEAALAALSLAALSLARSLAGLPPLASSPGG